MFGIKKIHITKNRSIKTILALAFFTVTLVALLITSGLLVYFNLRAQESAISNNQKLIANNAAKTVSSFVKEKLSILQTTIWISNPLSHSKSEQIELLQGLLGLQPSFQQFVLHDSQDKMTSRVSRRSLYYPGHQVVNYEKTALERIRKDDTYLSNIYIDEVTNEPLILIAIPVKDVFGEFTGSLMAEVNLKFMWDLVAQIKIGATGYVYVVDGNGFLISYEDAARVLKNENVKNVEPVSNFISNKNGTAPFDIITFNGINQNKVVGTYVPLGTPDWAVITETPWREAFSNSITELTVTGITLFLMAFLVSIVGIYLAHRLSVPVISLMTTASKITSGQKDLQAVVAGPKELASLADAFNSMTSRLNKSYNDLEEKIAEVKKAEEKLRISQYSIDKSLDAIFWLNKDAKNIYVNEEACRSLGYTKEELLELYLWDYDPNYTKERWDEEWESYQENRKGGGGKIETIHKCKDGTVFYVEVNATHTWFGDFELHVAHVRDISERKSQEEILKLSRFTIDSASDVIYWTNADGKFIEVNEAVYRVHGYTREEMLKMSVYDLDENLTEDEWKRIWRISKTEGGHKNETLQKKKDGKLIPVEIITTHIHYENREFDCAFVRDISDRKKAELELTKTKNYITNIINSMPSLLIGVDTENIVTLWNHKAEMETGIAANDAVGKNLFNVYPQLYSRIENINKAILEKTIQRELGVQRNVDDQICFEDITIFPLIANGVEGAVIRVDDKTEQKRLEEMMIQSEKMLSVGGLAAGMAHEINNPLAGILQSSEILKRRLTDTELEANKKIAKETGLDLSVLNSYLEKRGLFGLMENIRQSGSRAAEIVKNMLSFARKSDQSFSVYDIAKLLDETIILAQTDYNLKKKYDFKQIKIVKEYDSDLPLIQCEGSKIQQVFLNLLKNGAEAMGEHGTYDGSPKQFILRIINIEKFLQIEIQDNGPGMDEVTRKRVFEPFFTTKHVGFGTGLGLSVSYFIIVENHGGLMSVESEQKKGTKFIIKLKK